MPRRLLFPVVAMLSLLALFAFALGTPRHTPANVGANPAAAAPPAQIASEVWPTPAPQFIGEAKDWLNTNGKPLQLKKGTVYLVDYWEYTCVNCLRTLPYLAEWDRRYAKDGLVIVGIHTPEFAFAKDPNNVAAAVKRLGITWPVLIDSDYANWQAYHNSFWPRKYFVDSKGSIVADHAGEGGYGDSEALIQKLLKQANPTLKFPKTMAVVRGSDKPGAVCYPATPEIYAGERGHQSDQHGNITDFEPGKTFSFQDTGAHDDGKIYLSGEWKTEAESLRAGENKDAKTPAYAALKYHALECNAVIKPEGTSGFEVYVTQDDKPLAKADKGDDIRYDAQGASYLIVDAPRLYHLTKNAKFGSHELRLLPKSADFGLYSFTFSSCEVN